MGNGLTGQERKADDQLEDFYMQREDIDYGVEVNATDGVGKVLEKRHDVPKKALLHAFAPLLAGFRLLIGCIGR